MTTENTNLTPKNDAIERIDKLRLAINEDFVQNQLRTSLADSKDAFAASIIDLYVGDKSLQACDPKLLILQTMKAAILKLPINKSLGFAWIIAYKGVPQFQIGYKGLVQLAIRTAQYKHLNAGAVYEGEYVTANKLTGEFDLTGPKRSEKIIGYFSHFELLNGFSKTLYMTTEQVQAHAKKYSKSYNNDSSPWKTEFEAMATKTVLKNLLSKYGILSVEMANAIETDADEDVANEVMKEIRGNGNMKPMGFQEAEVTGSKINNGQHKEEEAKADPF